MSPSPIEAAQLLLCGDDTFGPGVKSVDCRGGFDFTVLFEEAILAILPAALFQLLVPFKAFALIRQRIRVKRNALYISKLAAIGIYTVIQLVLLVAAARSRNRIAIVIASAAISLFSGISLALLSYLEHVKSIRPSFLIACYLIATALFDIARVRTQWLGGDNVVAGALTASLSLKCVMLALEGINKRSLLLEAYLSVESTSGFISHSLFWWLNPLLMMGVKNILSLTDLPAIHEKLDSQHLRNAVQLEWDKSHQKQTHALAYACVRSLRWDIAIIFLPKLFHVGLSISQTYLIKSAVEYAQGRDIEARDRGYGLIGAFGLVYFGLAVATGWSSYLTSRLMSMMRGGLMTVIYAKMLRIPKANESAALTLMGTDVQRISQTFHFALVDAAPCLLQLVISVFLLYLQLGAVCAVPIVVSLVCTALSTLLTVQVTPRQNAWVEAVQRRINFTGDILGSMRNVKMLGLTSNMSINIQSLRDEEMETSKRYELIQALGVSLSNLPSSLNKLLVFAAYAIVAMVKGTNGLSVSQAMTSLSLLTLIDNPLSELISAVPLGWASMGCFGRIQAFLAQESHPELPPILHSGLRNGSHCGDVSHGAVELNDFQQKLGIPHVRAQDGSFGWSASNPDVVRGVNLDIQGDSKLTMVIGPVGCGKSTLLQGLLGETTTARGSVSMSSRNVSYCDQSPWIINGSIRDNILAGSEHDEAWYRQVVRACALDTDLQHLADGDSTVVGSKGMKLSGGQKQRISIARALYARNEIAICDDVLSGLDSVTEDSVFGNVFDKGGLFRKMGTCVILATCSVRHLSQADLIIALNQRGDAVMQDRLEDASTWRQYMRDLETLSEQRRDEGIENNTAMPSQAESKAESRAKTACENRKTGDWTTYKYYVQALGPWRIFIFLVLVAINATLVTLEGVWLNWWASSNDGGEKPRLGYWLGTFSALSAMAVLAMTLAICLLWVYINPRAGSNLHRSLLEATMGAPLSFFATTDTGVLVNRCDLHQVMSTCGPGLKDRQIQSRPSPRGHGDTGFPRQRRVSFRTLELGSCIVVVSLAITATGYFAAALPLVLATLYLVQRFYLRTSRQLRLLEIEASAPLFSQFAESLSGLVTIRSFGWTETFMARNADMLDTSQRPFYLLLCIQQWLVLVLDLVVAGLAVVLVGIATALRSRLNAGFLGLALVSIIDLSHALKNLIQAWTALETSMGAIARIKEFVEKTPCEETEGTHDGPKPDAWPTRGDLKFDSVSASYDKDTLPVLHDISFSIKGGEKLGIVGRTGSGKSSLALAMMRMMVLHSGTITIDGVDLSSLRASVVRERLSCLTQDAFLFPGSVRSNLAPPGAATDAQCVAALQRVGLWEVMQKRSATSGNGQDDARVLDMHLDASILSDGQRRLFCLGRALLKARSVLILDEPTSSVDVETDAHVQAIIRSEFAGHIVVMVAHKVSSLVDFDRVAVLDAGRLVELGPPAALLANPSGYFSGLHHKSV